MDNRAAAVDNPPNLVDRSQPTVEDYGGPIPASHAGEASDLRLSVGSGEEPPFKAEGPRSLHRRKASGPLPERLLWRAYGLDPDD